MNKIKRIFIESHLQDVTAMLEIIEEGGWRYRLLKIFFIPAWFYSRDKHTKVLTKERTELQKLLREE